MHTIKRCETISKNNKGCFGKNKGCTSLQKHIKTQNKNVLQRLRVCSRYGLELTTSTICDISAIITICESQQPWFYKGKLHSQCSKSVHT